LLEGLLAWSAGISCQQSETAIYDSETAMTTPRTIFEGTTSPAVTRAQYLLVRQTLSYNQIDGIC
jgi:hypothetical protein